MKLHSENQKQLGSDGAHFSSQPSGGRDRQIDICEEETSLIYKKLPGHRNPMLQNQNQPTKLNKTRQQ